jgi:hypothetical protein
VRQQRGDRDIARDMQRAKTMGHWLLATLVVAFVAGIYLHFS